MSERFIRNSRKKFFRVFLAVGFAVNGLSILDNKGKQSSSLTGQSKTKDNNNRPVNNFCYACFLELTC